MPEAINLGHLGYTEVQKGIAGVFCEVWNRRYDAIDTSTLLLVLRNDGFVEAEGPFAISDANFYSKEDKSRP